ncbi:MAG TPA: NUDIX domain-containing protein [Acidimicrobiales bacterium]|nr:NUDIX domain-containing protein [Acidimicrobiales bacterium]
MPRRSAGLLPYHLEPGSGLTVFIVHPGGPLHANKEDGGWTIAKGEYGPDEEPLAAARREFSEEVGRPPPDADPVPLGEIRQPGGKLVVAWGVEARPEALAFAGSNLFEMEWPPRSGRRARFPEVDRGEWVSEEVARRRLGKGQVAFLDRLLELVRPALTPGQALGSSSATSEGDTTSGCEASELVT